MTHDFLTLAMLVCGAISCSAPAIEARVSRAPATQAPAPGTPEAPPPETSTTPVLAATPAPAPQPPPPRPSSRGLPELPEIRVTLQADDDGIEHAGGCMICMSPIRAYGLQVSIPSGYEFEALLTSHGEVSIEAVAPDGRHLQGGLRVTPGPADAGEHELGVVVHSTTDPALRRIKIEHFEVDASNQRSCVQGPCGEMPRQPRPGGEPPVPSCSYSRLRRKGPVVFGHPHGPSLLSGWPQKIRIELGLEPKDLPGYTIDGEATVTCTTGQASIRSMAPARPGLSRVHELSVDTAPPRGERIVGGRHSCTVELHLSTPGTEGGEPQRATRSGTLRFEIGPDGYVKLPYRQRCVERPERAKGPQAATPRPP